MNRILIGSTYFFSEYKDFKSKDIDEIEIIETNEFAEMRQLTTKGKCIFQLKKHKSKSRYVNWALKSQLGMVVGKFLIPAFNKEIGFTIKDLKALFPLIQKLDDKHKYEEIIFNSYIENSAFILTKEQRDLAYQSYKETRGL